MTPSEFEIFAARANLTNIERIELRQTADEEIEDLQGKIRDVLRARNLTQIKLDSYDCNLHSLAIRLEKWYKRKESIPGGLKA